MSAPYYSDDLVTLHHGDCIEVMRELADESVHAVITDPPYGLEFMGREWDGADGFRRALNSADAGRDNAFGRASRTSPEYRAGHLFQEWTSTWAAEALRVLKPGGHLLAFGGSRTWHRLAAGIEDAGFEVRDSIAWLYGSGFPKSLDVSKAIDKLDAAAERLARSHRFTAWMRSTGMTAQRIDELTSTRMGNHYTTHPTQPSVPTIELFEVLRPHLGDVPEWVERLVVERDVESRNFAARGSTKTHAEGITRGTSGAGGGGEGGEAKDLPHTPEAAAWQGWGTALKPAFEPIVVARKPLAGTVAANVLQYGTGALNIDASRVDWGAEGDKSAGRKAAGYSEAAKKALGKTVAAESATGFASEVVGTDAARGRWPANVILDESQAAVLARLSGVIINGDQGGAARFFPTFRYEAKAPTHERPTDGEVAHPTVKPLDLMRWLVRLVMPPGGVLLEPFAGSGTTLEAAVLEGFTCIGIEREADYLPLIEKRLSKPMQQSLFGDWDGAA